MASRPMLTVQSTDGSTEEQIVAPYVFTAPLRPDLIQVGAGIVARGSVDARARRRDGVTTRVVA